MPRIMPAIEATTASLSGAPPSRLGGVTPPGRPPGPGLSRARQNMILGRRVSGGGCVPPPAAGTPAQPPWPSWIRAKLGNFPRSIVLRGNPPMTLRAAGAPRELLLSVP